MIIDSGGANIASVRFALERLGVDGVLTADPAVIAGAEQVILPGVGAAPASMAQLQSAGLVECIRGLTQPVLGMPLACNCCSSDQRRIRRFSALVIPALFGPLINSAASPCRIWAGTNWPGRKVVTRIRCWMV